MVLRIAASDLRRVFLHLQGLSDPPARRVGGDALCDLVERLGFVQVDSINTVTRAHHQILFSRNQTYRENGLTRLLERDRALFENWTHDAAVIPSSAWPYWRHRFERQRERLKARWTNWHGGDFHHEIDRVRDHIVENGPSRGRDFDGERERKQPGWWNWQPGKTALEYLWRTGEIAVTARENFAKIYDLAERVIPGEHFSHEVSHTEFVDWACREALARLGVATPGEIAAFYDLVKPEEAKAWCAAQEGRTILPVEIDFGKDMPRRASFARPDIEALVANAPEPPARVRALSPFDPVLRDRKRAERLFGFFYRIEVFVPAPKRTYGYYVYPLMEKDRLIGRIDMICRRAEGELLVTAFWPERGIRLGEGRLARLEAELARMARFTGMDRVRLADGWRRDPAG
ncbi:winged helix-turn-helix domain-containing protein [Stappia sp.]|uniref:winged helix-turn-helix domain-containing protein n=1 Tax=Stappia sp. TaxID=1870903 RepID=UPI003D10FF6F